MPGPRVSVIGLESYASALRWTASSRLMQCRGIGWGRAYPAALSGATTGLSAWPGLSAGATILDGLTFGTTAQVQATRGATVRNTCGLVIREVLFGDAANPVGRQESPVKKETDARLS